MADILVAQGRLREAVRTYEQSLQLAAEAGPEAQAITAHHHLGLALLYHEMGNAEASRSIGKEPKNWASARRWSIGRIAGMWHRPA